MGSYKIHVDVATHSASAFLDKVEGFEFKQIITLPIHNKGHIKEN